MPLLSIVRLFTVAILFGTCVGTQAQDHQYSVEYLTIDSGLPQNEVTSIIQDKGGFIWFGTRGGLARYDGHHMKIFQYEPRSLNSLSNNSIETLFEDSKGNIWIGTKSGGLNRFDPVTESFTIFQSDPSDPATISGNRVVSIQEDKTGRLWVGTWKSGLNKFDPVSGKFSRLLPGNSVLCMRATQDGSIWMAVDDQLYQVASSESDPTAVARLDQVTDLTSIAIDDAKQKIWFGGWHTGLLEHSMSSTTHYQVSTSRAAQRKLPASTIYSLLLDKNKALWLGHWGGGLNVLGPDGEVTRIMLDGPSGQSRSDYNIVLAIFQDRSGVIWVGTDGGGVCKIQERKPFFKTFSPSTSSLTEGHILSLLEDSNGTIWMGTKGGGINTLSNGVVTGHPEVMRQTKSIDVNVVYSIYEDVSRNVWFGTGMGLHKVIGFERNKIRSSQVVLDKSSKVHQKVTAILVDTKNRLWAGTQQHGLYKSGNINSTDPSFQRYHALDNRSGLSENRISYIFEDSRNRIWIGTYKGLYVYDDVSDAFNVIHHMHGDAHSLSNDIINFINEDPHQNIWVGTPGGLNLVTYHNNKLSARYYTTEDGLPNDYIHAILFDEEGNLWISSNAGIFEFNPGNRRIKIFTRQDGLQSNAFSEAAACKGADGRMYFGGINGLNVFNPLDLPPPSPSPLAFVSLRVMNREINPLDTINDRIILDKSITFSEEITLSHLDKVFSLEVSSIDFTSPEKNQYSFKLEGFDDDWVNAGHTKTISYTNLPAGAYTLYARASDVGNIWNDQMTRLSIRILPSPWLTWWAYLGYATVLCVVAAVVFQEIRKRVQLKNELHAAQMTQARTQLEKQKEKEISEMKMRFFTNVSHELRTPLTLISGPLEEMLSSTWIPTSVKERLSLMNRHTNKLLGLVNQLLDFRKTESGNLQLLIEQTEVVKYAATIFETFKHVAARRNIAYSFQSDLDHLLVEIDQNKIEIAITNIISNAFKYSSDGSEIKCHISIDKNREENKIYCLIQVSDTGRGMPADVLEKIFDLYYQVSVSESMKVSGSGIGLSLVKEVVNAHGGEVMVFSELGKGSTFTIKLPIKQSPGLCIVSVSRDAVQEDDINDELHIEDRSHDAPAEMEKPVVLVIEDTTDLRNYLVDFLKSNYFVLSAPKAESGLRIAMQKVPDVIISDVMMPEMNGFEFCQRIKTNEKTSHIPVILLTAKIMPESELLGLQNGADDYIRKPFLPSILTARIKRLLDGRKQLKEYYSRKVTLQPTNVEITSFDEKFLKKAMTFIEENLLNPLLNNEMLEKELGMSHSTLYRKLKALTGLSIHEFIRSIRLKRAAQLLESGQVSVSEAAYQTGFSEMKYFRAYFKNQFGCLPSEYVKSKTRL